MNKQDLRVQFQQNPEAFDVFKLLLFPGGINFCNPDFLVQDEDQARSGKTFDDDNVDWPSEIDVDSAAAQALTTVQERDIRDEYKQKVIDLDDKFIKQLKGLSALQILLIIRDLDKYALDAQADVPFLDAMSALFSVSKATALTFLTNKLGLYTTAINNLVVDMHNELDTLS